MAMSILIGNRSGLILGEIELTLDKVVWRTNDVGQITAVAPLLNVSRYQDLLQFGNTILIQFDNGLPPWGGVLDTGRAWEAGRITVNAYSGEQLLRYRVTGANEIYSQLSAGEIFSQALTRANTREFVGLAVETPYYGGSLYSRDYHFKPLLDVAKELVELTGGDFYVTAVEIGGYIKFTSRFTARRGSEKRGVSLVSGRNIADVTMDEQGPITNYWYTAGSGSSWYGRYVSENYDGVSMDKYRRREGSEINSSAATATVIDAIGASNLAASARPTTFYNISAINLPPATFADYDIGDTLMVDIPQYGFTGARDRVRVLAREYSPANGACALTVEENNE